MAEKFILACDVCGASPAETVTFRIDGTNLQKDYCQRHLAELQEGSRRPRRGRRPGASPKKTGSRKKSASRRKTAARRKAS